MYSLLTGFSIGLISGVTLVRYGIGLGAKITQRVQEGLPAFGRLDKVPVTQTHTSGIDEIEQEESYEDENER
jgi:hypothetical protein